MAHKPAATAAPSPYFEVGSADIAAHLKTTDKVDEHSLSGKSWFHGRLSKVDAESMLYDQEVGTFIIRLSESGPGLSMDVKSKNGSVTHFKMAQKANKKHCLVGKEKDGEWESIDEFLAFYSKNPPTSQDGVTLTKPCPPLAELDAADAAADASVGMAYVALDQSDKVVQATFDKVAQKAKDAKEAKEAQDPKALHRASSTSSAAGDFKKP